MTRPVALLDNVYTEDHGRWPYTLDGRPFTGLVVELTKDGWVYGINEVENGLDHGYEVSYAKNGEPTYVRQTSRHRDHGLRAEWDAQGRLISASRFDIGYLNGVLDIDDAVDGIGTERPVDRRRVEIEDDRATMHTPPPPMTCPIGDLLADADLKVHALRREAEVALGLKQND